MTKGSRIQTKIHTDILDTIGRSFKFNHGKGISEWLKNSLDNYLRLSSVNEESLPGNWPVIINLIDSESARYGPNLAVIDFGGTSYKNINDFFLYWGDTKAATLGGKTPAQVTGGHGNGGKFYMREMWRDGARFLSWRNGKCTSLILDKSEDGTTGEWEMENLTIGWEEALKYALNIDDSLGGEIWLLQFLNSNNQKIIDELNTQKRGFSVLVGRRAKPIYSSNDVVKSGRWDHQKLIDDIKNAHQAQRPIRELKISLFINGVLTLDKISLEDIEDDKEWLIEEVNLPTNLLVSNDFSCKFDNIGKLIIKKSATPLTGRLKDRNVLYIYDSHNNPIGYYQINELPLTNHSTIDGFLFGELHLDFMNIENIVENDREKLIKSPTSQSILEWVSNQICSRTKEFEDKLKESQKKSELEIAEILNSELNKHAHRFLKELETIIMIDYIVDPAGGGLGDFGTGKGPGDGNSNKKGGTSNKGGGGIDGGGMKEVPGNTTQKRRPKFPDVLLSGLHRDPSRNDGLSKILTDRHPPINQDDIDRQHNVWWINTTHPYACVALDNGGADGIPFKNYHLFLFMQIVQIESLRIMQRRQAELGLDLVENQLHEISNKFLSNLPRSLVEKLLK